MRFLDRYNSKKPGSGAVTVSGTTAPPGMSPFAQTVALRSASFELYFQPHRTKSEVACRFAGGDLWQSKRHQSG